MNSNVEASSQSKKTPDSFALVIGELLFTLLPFVVLFIVFAYQDRPLATYVTAPEWAFASSILFGQTVVKFMQGVGVAGSESPERIGMFISALIVLGIVPSMTVLALILLSPQPALWLGCIQVGLAIVAAGTFLLFGALGHDLVARR